jgi:hypothetical protein
MPPIAETIGPPPYVAPTRPFKAALSANNAPQPTLAPLGHGRGLEAPRGIVVGVARPTPAAAAATPRPVQRAPIGREKRTVSVAQLPSFPEPEPALETPPAPAAATSASPVQEVPVRRLGVIDSVAAPSARTFTKSTAPIEAPLRGYVGEARTKPAFEAATRETPAIIQRAPAMQAPAPSGEPVRASVSPAAAPQSVPGVEGKRLNVGQVRRSGLGAPITGGPMTSTARLGLPGVQRLPLPPVTPADPAPPSVATPMAAPLATPLARSATARVAVTDLEPGAPAQITAASEPGPVLGPRSVAPAPTAAGTVATAPAPAAVISRAPRGRMPAVPVQSLAPRIQRAPLTIPHGVQRSPRAGAPETPARSSSANGGPVKVHRGGTANDLSDSLDARSFTHEGEIFMPDSHGPLTSGVGRSLLAHELTHVVQQRQFGKALPSESSSHGRRLEAEAVAAERSGSMPIDMPLATEAKASTEPITELKEAQRAPNTPARAADTTTFVNLPSAGVQRAAADTTSMSGAAASPADKSKPSEEELEDLAHQLYARIGRRLRRELLVDRERAGLALDMP